MSIKKTYLKVLIFLFLLFSGKELFAQFYGWNSIGSGANNGTNGAVNAIVKFNNTIVFGGKFTLAGTTSVSNIAYWNGNTWSALGGGFNDTVTSLIVFNSNLYAGGSFTQSGSNTVNHIAMWNGTSWVQPANGLNGTVNSFAVFNGKLIAAGSFSNYGNNIASWDGSLWSQLNTGLNNQVFTLAVLGGIMYTGGDFSTAGSISVNKIASWNGTVWSALGTGMNDRVQTLSAYGSYIVAGGRFTMAGSANAQYIAEWNGSSWLSFAFQPDAFVNSLAYYNNSLIVGGDFTNVIISGHPLFVNKICRWDAGGCNRMITGTNQTVKTLYITDTSLYAGGDFTTAGGDYSYHSTVWKNQVTHSISGTARFADNNQLLRSGVVRAIRLDVNTREVIVVDTALIQTNGTYQIPHGINDSLDVILFPNDENADHFVPTYYPSTYSWEYAVKIFPSSNQNNIDIYVIRSVKDSTSVSNISGHVFLNFSPIFDQPGFPFSKDAIVYAKLGNVYKQFSISDSTQRYLLTGLNPGTYQLFADRFGFTGAERTVTLGTTNLDTINFYLDTASIIAVQNISTTVPEKFSLLQNYPNPFNPSTVIKFNVKTASNVTIKVYDILGREVRGLVNEELQPGEYKVLFNAENLPSGIYFYRMAADEYSESRKMIFIK